MQNTKESTASTPKLAEASWSSGYQNPEENIV